MTNTARDITKRTSIGAQRNPASEDAILTAAAEILTEGGLSAFSIEAVARRAKAGKPTIYRWWHSKAALLLDVYHRQKGETFYPDTGATRGDLIAFLEALLGFWKTTGGEVFRSIVAEAQSDPAALKALRDYAVTRCRASGVILERGVVRGEIRGTLDIPLIMELFSSFCWQRLLTGRLDPSRDQITHLVDAVLTGFATERGGAQ
ncbi:TetR/AcrR family transcriptional regulator [Rhizobium rosettiformans]|uniref:TetR/AcrR family transcriptional regulator n=1 Tax=Rhizobium rosettiformans TaxID=1368430 RepID=UPI002861B349|nr:TetR/AcrR family transcriptional regulator [Rhizobium rosettiformans]MDR7028069.1 AcrR family transcriptional regulator [Rhizobium rosettiformans]MDR7064649.1 AcrR family transcriptional regulator [Rhizobium rosettiformans]